MYQAQKTSRSKLIRITNSFAIMQIGDQIIKQPLTDEAKMILTWNSKNIPANQ